MMDETSTHFYVPISQEQREICLGPEGSAWHVARVIKMIQSRWKLPILFRLYADPSIRTLQLKRDLPGISQKMLTAHLRELARDGLIQHRLGAVGQDADGTGGRDILGEVRTTRAPLATSRSC